MNNASLTKKILKLDWALVLLLVLLVSIGCCALYSAAGANWNPWAIRHLERSFFGLILALIIAFTDIKVIYKFAWLPFLVSFLLLVILYLTSEGNVDKKYTSSAKSSVFNNFSRMS